MNERTKEAIKTGLNAKNKMYQYMNALESIMDEFTDIIEDFEVDEDIAGAIQEADCYLQDAYDALLDGTTAIEEVI